MEFKIGDLVSWKCNPSWTLSFKCWGIIIKIIEPKYGDKLSYKIQVCEPKYFSVYGRRYRTTLLEEVLTKYSLKTKIAEVKK